MAKSEKEVPYAEFGERLTRLRKDWKMSRAELGEKCGVAISTIANYENGLRIPYADTAVRMAQTFDMTVEELLGMENPDLAMAQEEGIDRMRSVNGNAGAEQLRRMYSYATRLAGGQLEDEEQLMELSLEMSKIAMLAQQKLRERHTNKKYAETVARKQAETRQAVTGIDEQIKNMFDDSTADLPTDD